MPRINLEDTWFDDPRRSMLIEQIGEIQTDGTWVKLIRLAQTYFRMGGNIPLPIFEMVPNWSKFETVGLVKRGHDTVRIAGQDDHFAWLAARKSAGKAGGIASGRTRNITSESVKQIEANLGNSQHPEPSSSSSSSSSSSVSTSPSSSKTVIYTPEFLEIWAKYPEGQKQEAFKRFTSCVPKGRIGDFAKAVQNYLSDCENQDRFRKHLSSFIGSPRTGSPWEEWVTRKPSPPRNRSKADLQHQKYEQQISDIEEGRL